MLPKYARSSLHTKWNTIICETSRKMTIINSKGSVYSFHPNYPKIFETQNKQKLSKTLTSTFQLSKMEIYKWNRLFCNFTQINSKLSSISKQAKIKLAKWVTLKYISLKSCKEFFCLVNSQLWLINERLTQRETKIFATL